MIATSANKRLTPHVHSALLVGEGTPKPVVLSSVPPASSGFTSLPHALATHHPQYHPSLGSASAVHMQTIITFSPPIHNTRLPLWVPRQEEPLEQSLPPSLEAVFFVGGPSKKLPGNPLMSVCSFKKRTLDSAWRWGMGVERTQTVAMRRAALWVRWSAAMCVGPSLCTRHAGILQHRPDELFVQLRLRLAWGGGGGWAWDNTTTTPPVWYL